MRKAFSPKRKIGQTRVCPIFCCLKGCGCRSASQSGRNSVLHAVGGEGCTGHAVDLGAVGSHNLLSQLLQSGTADALGLACALQLAVGDSAVSFHSQGGNDVAAKALAGAGLGNAGSSGGPPQATREAPTTRLMATAAASLRMVWFFILHFLQNKR